ncbi:unnamed protein product [marine sediment metagenome]|uniref:Uncharacterized protein n=1 Tax=marine sediment metagenome TaxID=412755 RepID=X1JU84_9ZZZZ
MKAKEYAENRIAEIRRDHGDDRTERVFSAEDVVRELQWVIGKLVSDEQYQKLPSGFVLYACEHCESGQFALDQNSLEDGGTGTEACCLGCGHVILV